MRLQLRFALILVVLFCVGILSPQGAVLAQPGWAEAVDGELDPSDPPAADHLAAEPPEPLGATCAACPAPPPLATDRGAPGSIGPRAPPLA